MIKSVFTDFNVDNIGNMYLTNESELQKYSASGKLFARYSNLQLGEISSVDATNPLKILLYYRDLQQIVFLDNQLSNNSENVSLVNLGYEQSDLVCSSTNNSFWIYTKQNNELLRFNENSQKIANTGNLKQVLQNDLTPNYITEHNGYLYLNCPENGIYVFDMFGGYVKLIGLRQLRQFKVNDNILYFQKDSSLCSYNLKLFEESCKNIPHFLSNNKVKYINGKLYQAFKDSLIVMPFN
ncbi:MAG: hypothetical protein WCR21_01755 [Bacteroidota bacterium]